MKLKLATRTKDGILVVDCSGRIVFGGESSLLRDTVKKAASENNHIVLNLGDVDSCGTFQVEGPSAIFSVELEILTY